MKDLITVTADDGRTVNLTAAQAQAVKTLNESRGGSCAAVTGYIPSTNWTRPPVQDIQLLTNFSTEKLYKRRIAALEGVEFADVMDGVRKDDVLSGKTLAELQRIFEDRKARLIASLQKTLDGDRSDSQRQAHDRCYVHIGGVKLHLVTEKVDGIMEPVIDRDGNVTVQNVMVKYLELNVTTREDGVRKVVNSGAPVRMGKLIERCLNQRSVGFKTLSLKADNFESFKIDGRVIEADVPTDFRELLLG